MGRSWQFPSIYIPIILYSKETDSPLLILFQLLLDKQRAPRERAYFSDKIAYFIHESVFYSKTSVFYLKRVCCSSFYLKNLCFISIKRIQHNPDPPGARYRDLVFFWQAKTFLYFRKQGTGSQLIYKSCCVCLCGFLVRQNKPAIKRQDSGGRDGSWKNILLLKPFYCTFLLSGIKIPEK